MSEAETAMGSITSLRDIQSAIRRWLWLIALIFVGGVSFAVWFALGQAKSYEAIAVMQIEAPLVTTTTNGMPTVPGVSIDNQLVLIEQKVMSRDSIEAMIEKFGIFPPELSMSQRVAMFRSSVRLVKLIEPLPDRYIASRADMVPSGLSIVVQMEDANLAATVANEILDAMIREGSDRAGLRASETLTFLSQEEQKIESEIADVEARIATFREANADSLPESMIPQNERLTTLNENLLSIDRELLSIQVTSDRQRAEDLDLQINLLQQQRALIAETIAETEADLAAIPAVEQELSALQRELNRLEGEYAVITTRRMEASMNQILESQNQTSRFEALERAIVPEQSVSASRKRIVVVAAFLSIVVGTGLALLLESRNPAIRTSEQMMRQLGVQPVVVVPYLHAERHRSGRGRLIGIVALLGGSGLAIWAAVRSGLIGRLSGLWPRVGATPG
jgi:tyrosine-protein kinase Etk/Wzc